ncbi:hypothetical protein M8J75_004459 [Diaphorina citri]|nr:hypothetical protein M8J75_004459 [Diaphorina citri]
MRTRQLLGNPADSELPLSKVSAPHPIINIVTQPQSYSISGSLDPGAPPQLTEEVVSPSSAIPVPARHAAPLFPQLISTPMDPPFPLSSSDSFLSAFVPTPSSNSPFYTPTSNTFMSYPSGQNLPGHKLPGRTHCASADKENAKNFFYQNIPTSSSENIPTGVPGAGVTSQSIGSPPRSTAGILLNPDMSNIASLPSVVSHKDS